MPGEVVAAAADLEVVAEADSAEVDLAVVVGDSVAIAVPAHQVLSLAQASRRITGLSLLAQVLELLSEHVQASRFLIGLPGHARAVEPATGQIVRLILEMSISM